MTSYSFEKLDIHCALPTIFAALTTSDVFPQWNPAFKMISGSRAHIITSKGNDLAVNLEITQDRDRGAIEWNLVCDNGESLLISFRIHEANHDHCVLTSFYPNSDTIKSYKSTFTDTFLRKTLSSLKEHLESQ